MTSLAELHNGPFKLTTKSQIRLLKILPGIQGTPVHAQLQVCDLQSKPRFEALSYVCGEQSRHGPPVYVNDIEVEETYDNLRRFLVRVRNIDKVRCVWVDALCINQQDTKEKAHQILLMGEIYRKAHRVLAWLGEHDELSAEAFRLSFTDHVNKFITTWSPLSLIVALPLVPIMIPASIYEHFRMSSNTKALEAYNAVLDRPYFNRIWIIQEVFLAKKIKFLCGGDSIDMRLFSKAYLTYSRNAGRSKRANMSEILPRSFLLFFAKRQSARVRSSGALYFKQRDIFELVHEFQHAGCSTTLDRVYALLALQAPSKAAPIIPDYDISVHELFVRICVSRLPCKVDDQNCQKVVQLFQGLKLDRNEDDKRDDRVQDENAQIILDILHHYGAELHIRSTVIRAFDTYGILYPARPYFITSSDDPGKIQAEYETWNQRSTNVPMEHQSTGALFKILMDPMWRRSEKFQRTKMAAAHITQQSAHNHMQHQNHSIQQNMIQNQIMQQNMMQNMMQNQTMQQNMMMNSTMMGNPGMTGC